MEENNSNQTQEPINNETNKVPLSTKKKIILYVVLIASIFLSSLSGVCAKFASGEAFLSFKFCLFYGLEILILGVYAIIWQQIIKHLNLSISYAFKATALIWTLVWGATIFNEYFSATKLIGVAMVIIGIIVVNFKKWYITFLWFYRYL